MAPLWEQGAGRTGTLCRSAVESALRQAQISVELIVEDLQLNFGDGVKAVGSIDELGGWSVADAPSLQWAEGHRWIGSLQLPAGEHNFKVWVQCSPARGERSFGPGLMVSRKPLTTLKTHDRLVSNCFVMFVRSRWAF